MSQNTPVQNQFGETASAGRSSIKRRDRSSTWSRRNWRRREERDQRAEVNRIRDRLGNGSYRRLEILAARQVATTILVLWLSRLLLRVHRTTGRHAVVLDDSLLQQGRSEHAMIARGKPRQNGRGDHQQAEHS